MSNMSITIRNQINAGSGKRAHPSISRRSLRPRRKGKGGSASSPPTRRCGMFCASERHAPSRASGTVEWPWDRFTQRRLRDGSIRVVEQADARKQQQRSRRKTRKRKSARRKKKTTSVRRSGARAFCASVINAAASASPRHLRLAPRAPARTAARETARPARLMHRCARSKREPSDRSPHQCARRFLERQAGT